MQIIRTAQGPDWQNFFRLASAEGWRVPEVERQLFAQYWPKSALALDVDGCPVGFVTALPHEQSGWIGNLIVTHLLRGRGYGSHLFAKAIEKLAEDNLSRLLLTASELGRPLYEKAGFATIGRIERWVCPPGSPCSFEDSCDCSLEQLFRSDRLAWGEDRSGMLRHLADPERAYICNDSVALLQPGPDLQIIGPWYSPSACPHSNRRILQKIMSTASPDVELVVDLLASSPVRDLLAAAGFRVAGESLLMIHGDGKAIDLSMMVSLASLGSFG